MSYFSNRIDDQFSKLTLATSGRYNWVMESRDTGMDERVRALIAQLREKGWTMAAIADELGVASDTVYRWKDGSRSPTNAVAVVSVLNGLLQRRRIPKRQTSRDKRNPQLPK